MTPTHGERQILQRLRAARLVEDDSNAGWIEGQGSGNELAYCITEIRTSRRPLRVCSSRSAAAMSALAKLERAKPTWV
jgi:hypothetical protein